MLTDDNDAYGDLDKSNLKFIYGQFLRGSAPAGEDAAEMSAASSFFTEIRDCWNPARSELLSGGAATVMRILLSW